MLKRRKMIKICLLSRHRQLKNLPTQIQHKKCQTQVQKGIKGFCKVFLILYRLLLLQTVKLLQFDVNYLYGGKLSLSTSG